jgi:acetyl coenzyme A synthetase (ADP forming)-like protein
MSKRKTKQNRFLDAIKLIEKIGIKFSETILTNNEHETVNAVQKIGFPAIIKVISNPKENSVIHKLKEGLVQKVSCNEDVKTAFKKLSTNHSRLSKKNIIDKKLSVAVQKEIQGVELIIGARKDPSFGCFVLFGTGGVLANEINDVSLRLCPITKDEAIELITETKAYKILGRPKFSSALMKNLVNFIVKLSNNFEIWNEVSELDINPVIVDKATNQLVAVDVRTIEKKIEKKTIKPKDWISSSVSKFFNPSSIALIGASRNIDSVGQSIMRNLTLGCVHRCEYCRPFLGKIFPVNPKADKILGRECFHSLSNIPDKVDLAIIAVPATIVPEIVEECIKKEVKAVIIISAGFGEFSEDGKKMQQAIVEKLDRAKIPMLGPNCLGLIRPKRNLNASFAPSMPPNGNVAFVSQSGALADSIIDWAIQERYGLSTLISYGNKAMLDCYDFFDFLANDEETKSVALYIEGVNNGKEFFSKLKKLSTKKPVVVLKGGRTESGINAASTHTASLAGNIKAFETAVKQAGAFLVRTVEELFDIAKVLAEQPVCKGNGIGIVTNGGGCGVICSDYCDELKIVLPELSKTALKILDKSGKMHPAYSRRNPLDIVGDALPERYEIAMNTLLKESNIHGLIVIQTLQAMTNPILDAKVIIEVQKRFPNKPIITCFMGGRFSKKGMQYLDNMKIPDFNDIRKGVIAMKALMDRGKFKKV